jgi:hypothetical protein
MKSKLVNLAALAAAVTVVLTASPNLKGAQFLCFSSSSSSSYATAH